MKQRQVTMQTANHAFRQTGLLRAIQQMQSVTSVSQDLRNLMSEITTMEMQQETMSDMLDDVNETDAVQAEQDESVLNEMIDRIKLEELQPPSVRNPSSSMQTSEDAKSRLRQLGIV